MNNDFPTRENVISYLVNELGMFESKANMLCNIFPEVLEIGQGLACQIEDVVDELFFKERIRLRLKSTDSLPDDYYDLEWNEYEDDYYEEDDYYDDEEDGEYV